MKTLFTKTVHSSRDTPRQRVEFSPLDLFARGHFPIGMIFGFASRIDGTRFEHSLRAALAANPEMGAIITVDGDGRHALETGHGIELIVQEHAGPAPDRDTISRLSLDEFPLARDTRGARELVADSIPVLGFRITYFSGGFCTLGARMTHSHIDGTTLMQFLLSLCAIYNGEPARALDARRAVIGRLAAGDGLTPSDALPVAPAISPRDARLIANRPRCLCNNIAVPADVMADYLHTQRALAEDVSSSDILCGLAWKAWAQSSPMAAHRKSRLYGHFNIRHVEGLELSETFLGNALVDRRAELGFGEVRSLPVTELARHYRRQTKPLNKDDIRQDIAYLKRLQHENAYDATGRYTHFARGFDLDGATGQALAINDVRLMRFDRIQFTSEALWYELAGDFHDRNIIEFSTRSDGATVIRYIAPPRDGALFKQHLENILTNSFALRAFGPLTTLVDTIELRQSY